MSAETPQPATAEGPQPSAQGAKAPSSGNQQLRIAILVVVAALVGVGLWLAFGHSKGKKGGGGAAAALKHRVGPVALTENELIARAGNVGLPFYWAGAAKGNGWHYEYTRRNDNIWVRYLPKGVKAGQKGGQLLIIGTYPLAHAYKALKKQAHGRGVKGKDGSFIWTSKKAPKSYYIVWPTRPIEVEVYSPNPQKAAKIAESGQVTTVGG